MKKWICLFLMIVSLSGFGRERILVTKIDGHVTQEQKALVINTLAYINKVWSNSDALTYANVEKYFTPTTKLIINGKEVYTGYNQFITHFQAVGKNIRGTILFPLNEMIGVDNRVIVRFDENIHDKKGTVYPANIMAIFTIEDGKIQQWEEVVNTKYFCQAESANVVFSK